MLNNNLKSKANITESPESAIKIGIAITLEEKYEIYRFRYKTYVEEMSKNIMDADNMNKQLYDELDEWGILLYAKIGTEVIATERINIGTLTDFPQNIIETLYLDAFQSHYIEGDHKLAYITKVMIAPAHRGSPVLYLLMAACYEICCHNQIQFGYGICNLHLLRLYEQMGWHRYTKNFNYPGYGLQVPIVLLADDIQHLRKVRSPLLRMARKRENVSTQSVEWFHTKFERHARVINSQLITEEDLWSILCEDLNCLPTESIALLRELTELEAKKFLHSCGSLIHCSTEDIITTQGDISYSYNILISGKLRSLTFHHPIKEYTVPGQHFGANGLTEHNKHTEDIVVVNSVEIFVLSGMAFPRFFHSHPDIAHKIVRTLSNLR